MGDKAEVLIGTVEVTYGVGSIAEVVGYTADGVTLTVSPDYADIKVDELKGTVIRKLVDMNIRATLNMAEGGLANMVRAIPGSGLDNKTLTIGGTALQEYRLTLRGKTSTTGRDRVIVLYKVNPTGEVGLPYKKGEITVIPITLSALVADSGEFGLTVDAGADSPTLTVGASTKAAADGTYIEAKFSKNMADPTGKHAEFYFTEADTAGFRQFKKAELVGGSIDTIKLTVDGVAITKSKALKLYYRLGTVASADVGILQTFAEQAVVARPA